MKIQHDFVGFKKNTWCVLRVSLPDTSINCLSFDFTQDRSERVFEAGIHQKTRTLVLKHRS